MQYAFDADWSGDYAGVEAFYAIRFRVLMKDSLSGGGGGAPVFSFDIPSVYG